MDLVFISSTSRDLPGHRQSVMTAVNCFPSLKAEGMENWSADTGTVPELIRGRLRDCSLYVGIIAWRYGSPNVGLSYTELEYHLAGEMKIDRLIFLADEQQPFSRNDFDLDPKKILDFRDRLSAENVVASFKSDEDLALKVTQALSSWERKTDDSSELVTKISEALPSEDQRRRLARELEADERLLPSSAKNESFVYRLVKLLGADKAVAAAALINPGNDELNVLFSKFRAPGPSVFIESDLKPTVGADLFVSFSKSDEAEAIEFGNQVAQRVTPKLGQAVNVLFSLPDDRAKSRELAAQSRVFLPYVTSEFLDSGRCRSEMSAYLENSPSPILFSPQFTDTERSDRAEFSEHFGNQRGFRFDDAAGGRFSRQEDPAESDFKEDRYRDLIEKLATQIAGELRGLTETPTAPSKTVYLADVSSDLRYHRVRIAERLEARGFRVLPAELHPKAKDQFLQAAKDDIAQSDLFVQILSLNRDDRSLGYFPGWIDELAILGAACKAAACYYHRSTTETAAPPANAGGTLIFEGQLSDFIEKQVIDKLEPSDIPIGRSPSWAYLAYASDDEKNVSGFLQKCLPRELVYKKNESVGGSESIGAKEARQRFAMKLEASSEMLVLYCDAEADHLEPLISEYLRYRRIGPDAQPITIIADPGIPPKEKPFFDASGMKLVTIDEFRQQRSGDNQ